MFAVTSARDVYDDGDFEACPALIIPYYDIRGNIVTFKRNGEDLPFVRARYLREGQPEKKTLGKKKKPQRYGQPRASGTRAYFPKILDWEKIAGDVSIPLTITEGEKKALAMCLIDVPTIGLGGVHNFLRDGKFLPELQEFQWEGRRVNIAFDSDAAENTQIQLAEAKLSMELGVNYGAVVHLVRVPKLADGKTGLDDYLALRGASETVDVINSGRPMRNIDKAVLQLNSDVCWIETEGKVYEFGARAWFSKDNFTKGSKYSALTQFVPSAKGDGVKKLSVSAEWLVHPLALRYDDIVMDPAVSDRVIETPEGVVLNTWQGFTAKQGDVSLFLELTEHLFQDLSLDLQDFPLKLVAYKAQNPAHKIPLALVLLSAVGGSGKSMWSNMLRLAFGEYGAAITPKALLSQFNGWLENTIFGVIDEAEPRDLNKGADYLKTLISEKRQHLNEKFRVQREINNYALFVLTSNHLGAGAYDKDDRRMFVVNCERFKPEHFYVEQCVPWIESGDAGPAIMHYLLNYDLGGWKPPARSPITSDKYMSYMESLTPVQRLAEDMFSADQNIVRMWADGAMDWAEKNAIDDRMAMKCREVKAAISNLQIRPFYTADELNLLFPSMATQLHGNKQSGISSAELSKQIRAAGVKYLRPKDDYRGFRYRGGWRQYLVVADMKDWDLPISQNDFERAMASFPTYGKIKGAGSGL